MNKLVMASLLGCAFSLIADREANATPITIDFESLAGTGLLGGAHENFSSTITIDGYTFSTDAGFGFRAALPINANYTGSVALVANEANANVTLSHSSSDLFSIESISLVYSNLAQPGINDLTFYGTKADSSVVSQTFNISSTLTNFSFDSSFDNLLSLSWTQLQSEANNHQFDNVAVTAGASPVPEPPAIMLLLLAIVGLRAHQRHSPSAPRL